MKSIFYLLFLVCLIVTSCGRTYADDTGSSNTELATLQPTATVTALLMADVAMQSVFEAKASQCNSTRTETEPALALRFNSRWEPVYPAPQDKRSHSSTSAFTYINCRLPLRVS